MKWVLSLRQRRWGARSSWGCWWRSLWCQWAAAMSKYSSRRGAVSTTCKLRGTPSMHHVSPTSYGDWKHPRIKKLYWLVTMSVFWRYILYFLIQRYVNGWSYFWFEEKLVGRVFNNSCIFRRTRDNYCSEEIKIEVVDFLKSKPTVPVYSPPTLPASLMKLMWIIDRIPEKLLIKC